MFKSMYIALIITLVLHTFSGTLHIYMVFYLSKAYYNFCLLKTLISNYNSNMYKPQVRFVPTNVSRLMAMFWPMIY